jgi:Tfp pilus assembly protein PilW
MLARLRAERGMALPELLVAIVVSLAVFGAAVDAFAGFISTQARADRQTEAQDKARTAIDRMAVQLRSAMSTGATSAQPIVTHSDWELIYLAPYAGASTTNNTRGLRFVRYCLDRSDLNNQKLWLQTQPYNSSTQPSPPATTACPNATGWAVKEVVASNLVNSSSDPLFTRKLDGTNVTDVAVHAVVDWDVNRTPPATKLQSKVTLRNLNRLPVAGLSCSKTNGHVICDASASSDPEGQAVTFAWKVDGASVSETSYRLDQAGLANGSHTFEVTVTDSGGLSSSTTATVSIP